MNIPVQGGSRRSGAGKAGADETVNLSNIKKGSTFRLGGHENILEKDRREYFKKKLAKKPSRISGKTSGKNQTQAKPTEEREGKPAVEMKNKKTA